MVPHNLSGNLEIQLIDNIVAKDKPPFVLPKNEYN